MSRTSESRSDSPSLLIDPSRPFAVELERIAFELAGDALLRIDANAPDAVHEVRKRLKELRALLRLTGDGTRIRNARRLARDAGRFLSTAREMEAITETFAKLEARFSQEMTTSEVAELRVAVVAAASVAVDLEPPRRMIAAAREQIAGAPATATPARARKAMGRNWTAAQAAMDRACSTRAAADFHEWRKREKELWYHVRMLEGHEPQLAELEPPLHRLSRLLGDHHDLAVLCASCAARADARCAEAAIRLLAVLRLRMRNIEDEALTIGRHPTNPQSARHVRGPG